MPNGTIIAITGGPGLGKSTLTKALADHYRAWAILEGEEADLPERIREDIRDHKRILELDLFFRNKNVSDYLRALKIKSEGGVAMLDTFWMTNDVYIEEWLEEGFEKELLRHMTQMDRGFLPPPDVTICITASETTIREMILRRGRKFEMNEGVIRKFIAMAKAQEAFFRKWDLPNTFYFDRTGLDFNVAKDLRQFTEVIDKHINLTIPLSDPVVRFSRPQETNVQIRLPAENGVN
jgi:deoxyadenosine/deoxycytidine kinase